MQIDPINIYKNKNALVLFGGNSSSQYLQYLKNINKDENILIVDSGVISKTLYNYKIFPNYIFSPFSEKLKWNYLHNVIYRLLLFNLSPEKFLKKEYKDQINFVRSNFDNFFEIWKPEKGVHKKYKFKTDKFFANSPIDNLNYFPNSKVILNLGDFNNNFKSRTFNNEILDVRLKDNENDQIEDYYKVEFKNNHLLINQNKFLNSSAIYMFPILNYLGFKKIYLLGMDMDFSGNFIFPAKKIFKSYIHFIGFIFFVRKSVNHRYKFNFPLHLRPRDDYSQMSQIFSFFDKNIVRVTVDNFANRKITGLKEMNYKKFLNEIKL
tara:strand:+ start:2068 stop:3033 length:966 start_codon:yes stop_codon:yes gene_type:complete